MPTLRRLGLLICAGLLSLSFAGCAAFGGDVENQLRPPRAAGEQGEIEQALADYVASTLTQERYVLKYPRSGEHRSAFLLEDLDGDGNREALAFYRLGSESGTVHLNLLRRSGGQWTSVSDQEAAAAEIHSVCFGDMDGDGLREVFICWDMYSTRTYQMTMYLLAGNRISERFTDTCTLLAVADLTGDRLDDCLLFTAETEALSVELWSMADGEMQEMGRGVADGYVQQIYDAHRIDLGTAQGLTVDCQKSGGSLVTELIYWENGSLIAPFFSGREEGNLRTLRELPIFSMDVDGDGAWEWPTCERLPGHGQAGPEDTLYWLTTFWGWDPEAGEPTAKLTCLYNSADRYYMLVEPDFPRYFTTGYVASTRTLWVYESEEGRPGEAIWAVRTQPEEVPTAAGDAAYRFRPLTGGGALEYGAWYKEDNEYGINTETLQYMLTAF